MLHELNDELLQDALKQNAVAVIKFGAEWCGPCKAMHQPLEELSNEMTDVYFGEVDVEEAETATANYKIRNVPTTIIFVNGAPFDKVVGGDINTLRDKIKNALGTAAVLTTETD